MIWLKNFERVQEIQQQIQWQPVTELEPRAFIPEVASYSHSVLLLDVRIQGLTVDSTLDHFEELVSRCRSTGIVLRLFFAFSVTDD